ncbi:hypothetical protein PRK78_005692 [Emydomyces testavorans]|uniref:Uncharacterized protein n=1 Tax=Emydomyces testavorans TaxID=2070801 RepID=A0AAF0IKX0_9EURO|nr:hypothetical protein PRK78_005692 [Emydomyces testavorans]
MAMESTPIARRGTNAHPVSEMSRSAVSSQATHSNNTMAETLLGVEPWMQEMLNEDLYSTPSLDLGSAYKSLMTVESDMIPSITDASWMNTDTWPAFHTGNGDLMQDSDDVLAIGAANLDSLDIPVDFESDFNSFLTDNSTINHSAISRDTDSQQDYDILPEPLATCAGQDDHSQTAFDQVAAAFRELARARAAEDPRPLSRKQKQRDASIALYLERLRDACDDAVAVMNSSNASSRSDNGSSFGSPNLSSLQNSFHSDQIPMTWERSSISDSNSSATFENFGAAHVNSHQASSSQSGASSTTSPRSEISSKPQQTSQLPVTGGVELVMDLNMNAATSLPRRHRPRTQAQRERYLAVRNRGACEKHKKQHKRCTCIDKELASKETVKQLAVQRCKNVSSNHSLADRLPSGQSYSAPAKSDVGVQNCGCGSGISMPERCECTNCDDEIRRWQLLQKTDRDHVVDPMQQPVRSRGRTKKSCLKSTLTPGNLGVFIQDTISFQDERVNTTTLSTGSRSAWSSSPSNEGDRSSSRLQLRPLSSDTAIGDRGRYVEMTTSSCGSRFAAEKAINVNQNTPRPRLADGDNQNTWTIAPSTGRNIWPDRASYSPYAFADFFLGNSQMGVSHSVQWSSATSLAKRSCNNLTAPQTSSSTRLFVSLKKMFGYADSFHGGSVFYLRNFTLVEALNLILMAVHLSILNILKNLFALLRFLVKGNYNVSPTDYGLGLRWLGAQESDVPMDSFSLQLVNYGFSVMSLIWCQKMILVHADLNKPLVSLYPLMGV